MPGLFRDSAGAAVVALMYADLPGVGADNSHWARCMAVQNINFMLGDNDNGFSYMVGFGCAPIVIREQMKEKCDLFFVYGG